jgi:hypothetical protein
MDPARGATGIERSDMKVAERRLLSGLRRLVALEGTRTELVPLPEVARRLGVPLAEVRRMVARAEVRAVSLSDGTVCLREKTLSLLAVERR